MTINAHQFSNQLDHRSISKQTNVRAEIWTGVLRDWKRALYQLTYQPLTILSSSFVQLVYLLVSIFFVYSNYKNNFLSVNPLACSLLSFFSTEYLSHHWVYSSAASRDVWLLKSSPCHNLSVLKIFLVNQNHKNIKLSYF